MRTRFFALALALVASIVFLVDLGGGGITHRDERVYARIAATMLETGDFLTPRYLGEPFFNKPPLNYWMIAASTAALGESPFAARLPSALFAIAGVLFVFRFGAVAFGPATGAVAALSVTGNWLAFSSGRLAMMDMPLAVLVFVALGLLLGGRTVPAFAVMGLAVLEKGPIGLVLPLGSAAFVRLLEKRPRDVRGLATFSGAAAFMAVAAPWIVAMAAVHGRAFLAFFFGTEHLFAFFGEKGRRTYEAAPYPLFAILSFGPLAPAVVLGLVRSLRARDSSRRACLVLGAGTLLLFTLAFRKADRYFVPAVAPLALLAADALVSGGRAASLFAFAPGVAISLLLALAAPLAVHWASAGVAPPFLLVLAALPFVASASLAVLFRRRGFFPASAVALSIGPVAALAIGASLFLGPLSHDPGPALAGALRSAELDDAPLAAETGQLETRINLLLSRQAERVEGAGALAEWLAREGRGGALVLRSTFNALPPGAGGRARVLAEDWQFARISWRLVRERGIDALVRESRVAVLAIERLATDGARFSK